MTLASLRLAIIGTASDRVGPFALLDLTPERCDAADVREAHERLSARLAAHPLRLDPDAVLLRREFDAAAALLLDPRTRQELIDDYYRARGESTPSSSSAEGPASPPPVYSLSGADSPAPRSPAHTNGSGQTQREVRAYPPAFLRDLLAAWVSAGGWNGKARHRIIAAGAHHGISGEDLLDAILTLPVSLAMPRATPLVGLPSASAASAGFAGALPMPASLSPDLVREAHEAAKRNLMAAVLAFLVCAAIVLPLAAWVLIEISRSGPAPIEIPVAAGPATRPPIEEAPTLPRVSRNALSVPINPMSQTFAGLLERLDRESMLADRLDAATLELFTQAATQGRRQWMQFDTANRERLRAVLVSSIYRLGDDPAAAALLVDVLDPDDGRALTVEGIAGRAWSIGMLAVILREPDLPPAARTAVEQHWRRHVPVGQPPRTAEFNDAARFALREMIDPLVRTIVVDARSVETWIAWLQCATSLGDAAQTESLATQAAGGVLIQGPDLAASDSAARVLAALFSAVRWNNSSTGRSAMLAWWDDPRVSVSDLAAVSSWLVASHTVAGLDESFILSISAGAQERTELRQRLSDAWKTGGNAVVTSSRIEIADWVAQTQRLLNEPTAASSESLLVQTIRAAYQNAAASLIWSGRPEEAAGIVRESDGTIAAVRLAAGNPGPVTVPAPNPTIDGRWAVRVFKARHVNDRAGGVELLMALPGESRDDTGPIDAAILAQLALGRLWRDIRVPALDIIVENYHGGPNVLLALADSMIPNERPDGSLSDAIEKITGEDLPDHRGEQWYASARLALLRHVANLRGLLTADAEIDGMAALLGDVYAAQLTGSPSAQLDAAHAARLIAEQWMEIGRPMQPIAPLPAPLDQIAHRTSLRAAIADDPIGRFHAWQIGALEAACYVTAAERPAARASLARLLEETTRHLASARISMEQLLIAERAMLRVWLLRFGSGVEGGSL